VATNLRLRPDAEDALRAEAMRTGRSQQDIIRTALDKHLGSDKSSTPSTELDVLVASGLVKAPRAPFSRMPYRLNLPSGLTTADLLDRDDRS
jgi:hypothetical protein